MTMVRQSFLARAVILVAAAAGCSSFSCRCGSSEHFDATEVESERPATEANARVWASFPEEPYDPKSAQEPRLQFIWQAPGQDRQGIWSTKLDGLDIRRTVAPDWLYSGEVRSLEQTPVRSPDGRYIACVGNDKAGNQLRYLIDRKARSVKTMAPNTNGAAHFNWTPDSRHVIFYGDFDLWDYEVETGTLKKLPMIYSTSLHLIDNGQRTAAVTGIEEAKLAAPHDGSILSGSGYGNPDYEMHFPPPKSYTAGVPWAGLTDREELKKWIEDQARKRNPTVELVAK